MNTQSDYSDLGSPAVLARVVWPALGVPGGMLHVHFMLWGLLALQNTFSRALIKRRPADFPGDRPFLFFPFPTLMAGHGGVVEKCQPRAGMGSNATDTTRFK
jgi:hypothetical protein